MEETKTRTSEEIVALTPIATANSKQSLTPNQINIKSHTKGLFFSVSFIQCTMSSIKKFQSMPKEKTQTLKRYSKQQIQMDLDIANML